MVLDLHEFVLSVEGQQPETGGSLEDVLVGGVFALLDCLDHGGEDGDVSVGEGNVSAQENLGVVPDVHHRQSLLLQLQHVQACLFNLT
jgi:hypothetical protein